MTYEETIQYLYNSVPMFQKVGAVAYKEGLENTFALDNHFGNPHKAYKTIHIAGTNGKGSCSHTLAAILQAAGYTVGLYTSPHLKDFRERIRVNGKCISEKYVVDFVEKERAFFEPLHPSFFELTTALAFKYFKDSKVDVAVVEVGLGGRLDCTNIITPVLSVITNISFDHTQFLGDTLAKIAYEKAGILKPGVPLFSGRSIPPEAYEVIAARARELGVAITRPPEAPAEAVLSVENGIPYQCFEGRKLRLLGAHQRGNLLLAECVLNYLAEHFHFDAAKAAAGFSKAQWPARFQVFPEENMVFDGAHNPECAAVLASTLREVWPGETFSFIYGSFADKNSEAFLRTLAPLAADFTFIPVNSTRPSRAPEVLAELLHGIAPDVPGRPGDLKTALETETPHRKVLCGSLHLCGEALAMRRKRRYVSSRY